MSHSKDAPGSSSFGTTISGGTPNQLTQFNATGDNVVDSNLGSTGNQTTLTEGTEAAPSFVMSQNTNTGINMKENGANGWLQHINNGAVIVHMYHSFWDFKVPITTTGAVTCAGITSSGTVKTTNGILEIGASGTTDRVTISNAAVTANRTQDILDRDGKIALYSPLQTANLTADDTAITVTSDNLLITSDNATATNRTFTLATTGIQEGQPLTILFDDATNQAELQSTTDNLTIGGATITFNATGQQVEFKFINSKWRQQTALVAVS